MYKNRVIGIIGHFGAEKEFFDGQTVKTKILFEELFDKTNWKIIKVDTYYKKTNPLKLLFDTIICLLKTKDVIVLLSGNGMKFYFPLLYYANKVIGTRVYHDVIGGNLDSYVIKYSDFRKYLNSFQVNWVETTGLKDRLFDVGVFNCNVIPNFKRLKVVNLDEQKNRKNAIIKFCTFSRVVREKGIEDAIFAIQRLNEKNNDVKCLLDIYGPIDSGYTDRFQSILNNTSKYINYCGIVDFDKSSLVLKQYDALLFPTFWNGEGFPGTIVDAFAAGIPVIATDWNCNSEIVDDMRTGIIYPNKMFDDLCMAIEWFTKNQEITRKWKLACIKQAMDYQPDKYVKQIIETIECGKGR